MKRYLKIHERDNVVVALENMVAGDRIEINQFQIEILEPISLKHKIAIYDIEEGDLIKMYGLTVGKALKPIFKGARISTENTIHATEPYHSATTEYNWQLPDINRFKHRTFKGYHRKDGSVGTRNYWIILPLVFCEKRNVEVIQEALVKNLG